MSFEKYKTNKITDSLYALTTGSTVHYVMVDGGSEVLVSFDMDKLACRLEGEDGESVTMNAVQLGILYRVVESLYKYESGELSREAKEVGPRSVGAPLIQRLRSMGMPDHLIQSLLTKLGKQMGMSPEDVAEMTTLSITKVGPSVDKPAEPTLLPPERSKPLVDWGSNNE